MTAARKTIDLNCDAGESFGRWRLGDDEALFTIVTSASVACGYHAGDPATIEATIRAAKARGVAVGAHPSYPDLSGFGRRSMAMSAADVEAMVVYQIGAVEAIARANGVRLAHVKPHGALYNDAAMDPRLADAIASAALRCGGLPLFGLAGSALMHAARDAGLSGIAEAFCDRAYEGDGTLRRRELPGSVIADPAAAARQAVDICTKGRASAFDGTEVALAADTLCIHGDTRGAVAIATAVRSALESAGVRIAAPA
jgi:5-oxoprolinase (ATP-hydrolysing) subunit A